MAGKYCLPKSLATDFKRLLKSGEIDVDKLAKMESSEARHRYFASVVGDTHATSVNALFEKQLLAKNFYNGAVNWIKTLTGVNPQVRRDLISRIEKIIKDKNGNLLSPEDEKDFLQDLVEMKLGINLSVEEGKTITLLSNKLAEAKTIFERTGKGEEYGVAQSAMERFLSKTKTKGISDWSWNPLKMIEYIASNTKAIAASLDNSFALRQGIKTLFTHPVIWSKDFVKSFGDLAKGFKNGRDDVIDGIKAEVYGRKNSINGTYQRMKLQIGGVEESYAGTLGQKIPVFKRLFEASEAAYEGMGIRLRADLADKIIEKATKQGIDLTDNVVAEDLGKLINSLTGRGSIGKLDIIGKEINVAFFSIKFLKGNWDVLTAHSGGMGLKTSFARKEAAQNLAKIVGSIAGIMVLANKLYPGSVESDPRSSDFGKIKIGNTRFDITGGMSSIVVLASRLITLSSKSQGIVKKLNSGYGSQTGMDIINSFWEGKLSPLAGLFRDLAKQRDYSGNPITYKTILKLGMPIPVQTFNELMKNPDSAPVVFSMIADMLGVSTNTYAPSSTNWNLNTGTELKSFKDKIGEDKFNEANVKFNQQYNTWFKDIKNNLKYQELSDEDKQRVITKRKDKIKNEIFNQYHFRYNAPKAKKIPNL